MNRRHFLAALVALPAAAKALIAAKPSGPVREGIELLRTPPLGLKPLLTDWHGELREGDAVLNTRTLEVLWITKVYPPGCRVQEAVATPGKNRPRSKAGDKFIKIGGAPGPGMIRSSAQGVTVQRAYAPQA